MPASLNPTLTHSLTHLSQDEAKSQKDDDREYRETARNGHSKDHTQLPLSGAAKREMGILVTSHV